MEYHSHIFEDYSLIIYKANKIIAVLPANRVGDSVYSHQGLTYGGLIYSEKLKLNLVIELYSLLLNYLKENGIKTIYIKELPRIYSVVPNDDFKYIAFILQAELIKRDALSVIDYKAGFKVASNRKEGVKKANQFGLVLKEENNFDAFWNSILIPNLKEKHQAKPVHSLEEIKHLKKCFPNNIKQFNVYKGETLVAGTTIFETKQVAHCQYISGDKNKNTLGCLDFLHHQLITEVFKDKAFYDFGISNENNGLNLNQGLLFWKEGFGARTITQDVYKIDVNNAELLKTVLI